MEFVGGSVRGQSVHRSEQCATCMLLDTVFCSLHDERGNTAATVSNGLLVRKPLKNHCTFSDITSEVEVMLDTGATLTTTPLFMLRMLDVSEQQIRRYNHYAHPSITRSIFYSLYITV